MAIGVRRPHGWHGGRFVGKWTSTKTGETMWWESSLERAHLRPLEWDPDVGYYVTQPLRLKWMWGGAIRRWTPDLLRVGTARTLIEVKPFEKTQTEEFWTWAAQARNAAQEKGYEFQVCTERDLPAEPKRSNIDLLLRHRNEVVPESVAEKVARCLSEEGWLPVAVLADRLDEERALPLIYCLMARHAVAYDINRPMGPDVVLRPRNH